MIIISELHTCSLIKVWNMHKFHLFGQFQLGFLTTAVLCVHREVHSQSAFYYVWKGVFKFSALVLIRRWWGKSIVSHFHLLRSSNFNWTPCLLLCAWIFDSQHRFNENIWRIKQRHSTIFLSFQIDLAGVARSRGRNAIPELIVRHNRKSAKWHSSSLIRNEFHRAYSSHRW